MPEQSEIKADTLLETDTIFVRNVHCTGICRHRSSEECASSTHLVFPYRGLYVRHVGQEQAVADANHVIFFNANEGYRISHPLPGGDASLSLRLSESLLQELAPPALRHKSGTGFRHQHHRIDPRAQALAALLRHSLENGTIEALEAESLTLTLICRSLGTRTSRPPSSTPACRKLADRVKVLLASDLARRWTLAEIAAEIRCSPVYLTQIFQQTEGLPLYRYQLRLRLARFFTDTQCLGLGRQQRFSAHCPIAASEFIDSDPAQRAQLSRGGKRPTNEAYRCISLEPL